MENHIPAIAQWLGSNALIFFAVATCTALLVASALWWLLVRRLQDAARVGRAAWSRLPLPPFANKLASAVALPPSLLRYLTAYVVIAFILAFIGVAAFVELADEVQVGEDIAAFDDAFTDSLRASTQAATLAFFRVVTRLGDTAVLTTLCVVVGIFLLWRRHRLLALVWTITVAGNGLLIRGLKSLFERTRPIHEHGLLVQEGWSFPSGHAAGSMAVYMMLLYLVLRGRDLQWWHLPAFVAGVALILLVGFSRVFLQVHYVSDVVAGYVVAASWLCICIAGNEIAHVASQKQGAAEGSSRA